MNLNSIKDRKLVERLWHRDLVVRPSELGERPWQASVFTNHLELGPFKEGVVQDKTENMLSGPDFIPRSYARSKPTWDCGLPVQT